MGGSCLASGALAHYISKVLYKSRNEEKLTTDIITAVGAGVVTAKGIGMMAIGKTLS